MNSYKFWNMLSEDSKYKVEEMLSDYSCIDFVILRIFELYEEGAALANYTLEDYLEFVSPNEYVDYSYESYLERQSYYKDNF